MLTSIGQINVDTDYLLYAQYMQLYMYLTMTDVYTKQNSNADVVHKI